MKLQWGNFEVEVEDDYIVLPVLIVVTGLTLMFTVGGCSCHANWPQALSTAKTPATSTVDR